MTTPENYHRDCQALQERFICPNCKTIWSCTCTLEERFLARQRLIDKATADWHKRLRQYENDRRSKSVH